MGINDLDGSFITKRAGHRATALVQALIYRLQKWPRKILDDATLGFNLDVMDMPDVRLIKLSSTRIIARFEFHAHRENQAALTAVQIVHLLRTVQKGA